MCIIQKVLKTTTSTPHPSLQQSRRYFQAQKVTWLRVRIGADLHPFQTRFVIGWENNGDGDITMPLSLKTIGSAGYKCKDQ